MTPLTLRQFNNLKLCSFIRMFAEGSFSIKVRYKENQGWNVLCIRSMMSLISNSKIFRFITLRKLIKTPENFFQGFFSVKLTNILDKNRGEGLASGSL